MLPRQNIPPQQPSQRRTKRSTESTIIDTESHAVNGSPPCAIADRDSAGFVDLLPCLDDAREEDRGADICSGELDD